MCMRLKTARGGSAFITPTEASHILKISAAGVRYLARTGKLRVALSVGPEGGRLFRRADVEALARARAANGSRRSPEPDRAA
jgi:hypothetical protein